MNEYNDILNAVKTLAAKCDGAVEEDYRGFNKFDSIFGHNLAARERLTSRQARAAWKMLHKYKVQLSRYGINYDSFKEPVVYEIAKKTAFTKSITNSGSLFQISFPFNEEIKNNVKNLPGRRWNPEGKFWTLVLSLDKLDAFLKFSTQYDFTFSETAWDFIQEMITEIVKRKEASRAVNSNITIKGLGGTLRPFQKAGVAYALQAKRTFIADEMGLGKTIEALAVIQAANAYPALVICPASLKLNWQREAEKWLPGKGIIILNGKIPVDSPDQFQCPANIYILNYDILKKWKDFLSKIEFQAVIFDESHYCKNYKAIRTKMCMELSKKISIRLALTGTPILNRPQELLSQLGILDRLNDLGGFWNFAHRYCQAFKSHWGWDFSGAAHLEELNEKMRAFCYVRREKSEVLKELPAKQRAVIPVQLSNRKEYDRAEADLSGWLREQAKKDEEFQASIAGLPESIQKKKINEHAEDKVEKAIKAEQLVRIEALKRISSHGKMETVYEWIESFLETGEKLVVFAHHKDIVRAIADHFKAPSITGETSSENRQAAVDSFQNDDSVKIIVCNIQAGGVGITLTSTSNVAFIELGWNPSAHDQAEDRCHRIGQSDQVTAWYFLGENSIDEKIFKLIEEKRIITKQTIDGAGEPQGILGSLVSQLKGIK